MQREKIVQNISAVAAALVMAFAVVFFLVLFQSKMTNLLSDMALQNISETQALCAETLRDKINGQIKTLESQAEYFYDADLDDTEKLKKLAKSAIASGDFFRVAVVNEDGAAVDYSGRALPNMKNKDYFASAMLKGEAQIPSKIELDEHLNPCLTITVPFKTRDKKKGAMAGFFSYDILLKIFSIPVFSGQSYFYIVSGNGNILLFNKDKNKTLYNIDVYDYIEKTAGMKNLSLRKMKVDMVKSLPGCITVEGVEGKKIFSYVPLGISDWHLIMVLPYSYIKNQQLRINILVYILLGGIAFAILVFVTIVYVTYRRSLAIKKDNERLTIANNQAQTLIFEYDVKEQKIDFSGDTQFLLGTDKKSFTIDFVRKEYFARIHPEDKNIFERARDSMRKGKENFSSEFRYKSFSNNYFWVKMTVSAILDEKREPTQFIGSIANVNSQVLHEQELRNIADRDKLSSLLNKSAFERMCKGYLFRNDKKRLSALIIIDLDNFKEVNDNLGHMTGDLAIQDAAKKISLIFSEKDFLGRFGGDEFCVLVNSSPSGDTKYEDFIREKCETLCNAYRAYYSGDKGDYKISASIGVSFFPEDGSTFDELYAASDKALYSAKKCGKDSYAFYSKEESGEVADE